MILGQDVKLGKEGGNLIEFVRLKKDSELMEKKRKMPDKEEPEEPPPPPELDLSKSTAPDQGLEEMAFNVDVGLDLGGGPNLGVAASDTDVVPIVRVQLQPPTRSSFFSLHLFQEFVIIGDRPYEAANNLP